MHGTLNGFGLTIYGDRDAHPDGSHVKTRFLAALFVPSANSATTENDADRDPTSAWSLERSAAIDAFASIDSAATEKCSGATVGVASINSMETASTRIKKKRFVQKPLRIDS